MLARLHLPVAPCARRLLREAKRSAVKLDRQTMSTSSVPPLKRAVSNIDVSELRGKTVFVRADLNAPRSKSDSSIITDDTRIRATIPTLELLVRGGARVVLASHAGRPKGKVNEDMRLEPMGRSLQSLLPEVPVHYCTEVLGHHSRLGDMQDGSILLLENLRFDPREEQNDEEFSRQLAEGIDVYVNDAFGAAHRAHASTAGIANFVDLSLAGLCMEQELDFVYQRVDGASAKRPLAAIIGGAKVSSKIGVIESLLDKVDHVLIGGGMMFTFLKAQGHNVGNSLVEEDYINVAAATLEKGGSKILLPSDTVVSTSMDDVAETQIVPVSEIPAGHMGLDIGPDTVSAFSDRLGECGTCIWNGPMGVFEVPEFAQGTFAVAKAVSSCPVSIIGGGDSVAAIHASGLADRISHISTGGGASLELLEGKTLPGVAALDDA